MPNWTDEKKTLILPLVMIGLFISTGCVSLNSKGGDQSTSNRKSTPFASSRTSDSTREKNQDRAIFDPLPSTGTSYYQQVKAGDQLKITIEDEQWGGEFTVPSTGTIDLQFIGSMQVAGFTLEQIRKRLREKLHPEYFIDPDIIVNFKKITPNRVLVMGQVGKPDHVKVDRGEGIMDALVEAGYLTRNSVRTQMYVFREDDGETHVYHANYEKYARGNLRQNIPLQNGDLVYVRTHFWPHFDRLQDVLETIGFGAGTADTIRDAQN